jgi:hypothetical protein
MLLWASDPSDPGSIHKLQKSTNSDKCEATRWVCKGQDHLFFWSKKGGQYIGVVYASSRRDKTDKKYW